jgi:hypothetical protein
MRLTEDQLDMIEWMKRVDQQTKYERWVLERLLNRITKEVGLARDEAIGLIIRAAEKEIDCCTQKQEEPTDPVEF